MIEVNIVTKSSCIVVGIVIVGVGSEVVGLNDISLLVEWIGLVVKGTALKCWEVDIIGRTAQCSVSRWDGVIGS